MVLVAWVWYSFHAHNTGSGITFHAYCYKKNNLDAYTFYKMGKVLGDTSSSKIILDDLKLTVSYGKFMNNKRTFVGNNIEGTLYKNKVEFNYNGKDYLFSEVEYSSEFNKDFRPDESDPFFKEIELEAKHSLDKGAKWIGRGQPKVAISLLEAALVLDPNLAKEVNSLLVKAYKELEEQKRHQD